jgi:proteasome lid subunit RPN8/RPN11
MPARGSAFAEPVLRLTQSQYEAIIGHCYAGFPLEACGLLAGPVKASGEPTGKVTEARPCANAEQSSCVYTVDSRDLLHAQRDAEARGEDLIGCWHSHTHTDAFPSPTDVTQAEWYPTWIYVIVSLKEVPVLHAYRIRGGEVAEVQVTLEPD